MAQNVNTGIVCPTCSGRKCHYSKECAKCFAKRWGRTQATERLKVGSRFVGWETIQRIVEATQNKRDRLLVMTLFKTGGRVTETLALTKQNFDFDTSPESIIVLDMQV